MNSQQPGGGTDARLMNDFAPLTINTRAKVGLGAALAAAGALCIVLSRLLGWPQAPWPWDFLSGFVAGVLSGLGATLVVAGLIRRRRG